MPEPIKKRMGTRVYLAAEFREGKCENCGTQTELIETDIINVLGKPMRAKRPLCPICGGKGKLWNTHVSVQPPDPPSCGKDLFRYFRDTIFSGLLALYHAKRMAYASEAHKKRKKILDRYITGEPAPTTIWQAIHANLKLKCFVCRKYDVDPLLFSNQYKGG